MIDHLRRLCEHMAWADEEILTSLGEHRDERALHLFAHLLAAERVWLARLRGEDGTALEIWPRLSLEECAGLASENRDGYADYLAAHPDAGLDAIVRYRTSSGTSFGTSVLDILTHVAMHGSYHRGQVASALRGSGGMPSSTDYIRFSRERAVDSGSGS